MTFSNTTSFTYYFRCFILECLGSSEIFQFECFIKPQVYKVTDGMDWLFIMCLFNVLHNGGLILDWILLSATSIYKEIMMIKQVWLITEYNAVLWWYFFFLLRKEERKHSELLEKIFCLPSSKDHRLPNTAMVLQMLGRLCWGNEHNYVCIWKTTFFFFFVPVAALWIESCKIAETTEEFAASERAKSILCPSCEQDAALTLGLVLIWPLSKLIQLPTPAKT